MKTRKISIKTTTNTKVLPAECPLKYESCYENLGEFEKRCPFCSNFWDDTRSVECKFDDKPIETQNMLIKLALSSK